jgi:NADPH:quinone reductase-like Zn-dependent oxidoreductase
MRSFAILGAWVEERHPGCGAIQTVVMDDVPIRCAVMHTADPVFDHAEPANRRKVLVRVKAFSLNYRDKNRIFTMVRNGSGHGFYPIGSEFVAEVLAVGPEVTRVAMGDRVIGDCAYPDSGAAGVAPGVPSNHGSKEFQILHEVKLVKVPDSMPDTVAAAFSIGAQTNYSMIRRLELFAGANVLVTAAKSNTSLFAINALRNRNVNIYATSSSRRFETELRAMGVKDLAIIDESGKLLGHPALDGAKGGIHFAIDPYWDLHRSRVLEVLAFGGKYISCGLYDQYLAMIGKPPIKPQEAANDFPFILMKNLHMLGNCIGASSDLTAALGDFAAGALNVNIDRSYSRGQEAEFVDRTYNSKDRFGKVVYQYN